MALCRCHRMLVIRRHCTQPPACHFLLQGNVEWAHNTVQLTAGHTGRVAALAFSPFFRDALLAVGDSGFTVWRVPASGSSSGGGGGGGGSEASAAGTASAAPWLPLFESPFSPAMYTCGCWSPSKPGEWGGPVERAG